MVTHLLDLSVLKKEDILEIIYIAEKLKKQKSPLDILKGKTLLMMFEKPSLRTRLSFEAGMTQLGGHAIYYDLSTSPMGKKESVADTAKTSSRFVDMVMARMYSHEQLVEFAQNSDVPVINGLTDKYHPCQILSDIFTIKEKKGLNNIKIAYLGDANNNVTHSLLYGCALMGIDMSIACPGDEKFMPQSDVEDKAGEIADASGTNILITSNPKIALEGADIVYTDSWMSYHVPEKEKKARSELLMPYQVDKKKMAIAKKDALFMNCLPAQRGMEQTAEVIDGKQSIVFGQAENRLHVQKALMLWLLDMKI